MDRARPLMILVAGIAVMVATVFPAAGQSPPPDVPASRSGGTQEGAVLAKRLGARKTARLIRKHRKDPPVIEGGGEVIADPPTAPLAKMTAHGGPPPAFGVTPEPETSWKALGPSGGFPADPQIAVSDTHVVVTERMALAFYDKAGTKLAGMNARSFFQPMGLDDGTADAVNRYNDLRAVYDEYRGRFWIGANGANAEWKVIHPSFRRPIFAVAVSKTQNPLDGWYFYHWRNTIDPYDPTTDGADYPILGIGPDLIHQTTKAISDGTTRWHLHVFPADQMAAGQPGPISGWHWWDLTNPAGTPIGLLQPTVHHGPTTASYYAGRVGTDQLIVWRLTDPLTPAQKMERVAVTMTPWSSPVNAPQLGSASLIKMTNLGTAVQKSVYRDGKLYLVTNDLRSWGNGADPLTSVRLIRLDVSGFPAVSADDPGTLDITFGQREATDQPTDRIHMGWPSVEVNKHGALVVVYARTSAQHYPEIHYKLLEPATDVLRTSALLKAGEASHVRGDATLHPWGDLAGASVEPTDDEGIWIAHQYAREQPANNGNYQMWVGKVAGPPYPDVVVIPDLRRKKFIPKKKIDPAGPVIDIVAKIRNQGDGFSKPGVAKVFLANKRGNLGVKIGTIPLPKLRPGEVGTLRGSLAIPDHRQGVAFVSLVLSPKNKAKEYDRGNNVATARLTL